MHETKMPEIYVEGNDIVITNSSKEARDSFYKEFSKRKVLLSDVEFKQLFPNSSAVNFSGVVFRIPEGKRVRDAKIFVNIDDFLVEGENFSDLIEISIRHEAAEMYMYAKLGYSLSPAPPA